MEPTYIEISRACQLVLKDVFQASGGKAVAVPCLAIRSRVALSDKLWAQVSADLRHSGMVCHDGDEAHMTLTTIGAAQSATDANRRTSTAA